MDSHELDLHQTWGHCEWPLTAADVKELYYTPATFNSVQYNFIPKLTRLTLDDSNPEPRAEGFMQQLQRKTEQDQTGKRRQDKGS